MTEITKSAKQVRKASVAWRFRPGEQRVLLLIGDILVVTLAEVGALFLWAQTDYLQFGPEFLAQRVTHDAPWFYLLPVAWLIFLVELYDVRRSLNRRETFKGVMIAAVIFLAIYLPVFFLTIKDLRVSLPRSGFGYFLLLASGLTLIWRNIFISIFSLPRFMRRVLIVGAGKAGTTLLHILDDLWPPPFYIVGLIDDDDQKKGTKLGNYTVLAGCENLLDVIRDECVSDLILAISGEMSGQMFQAILDAEERGVEVTTMPIFYEETLGRVPIFHLDTDWILRSFVDQAHASGFYEIAKRLIDLAGGLVGSIGMLFLLPFIALSIVIDSGFPIFFMQNRLGKNGRTYKIIKFRTMRQDSEGDGEVRTTSQNDERITRVGLFLRKSHLDELPQFFNVLKGEMSLVGPRAERSELVAKLQQNIPFYRARLLVKPGITGWAQVNFGYAATVEDTAVKLEFDLYYIKHRTLSMDFIILLRTAGPIFGLRGQ
jgi:exopolysaccharide biosynthesis polyprenyl glycosylphosphotransferase